MFWREGGDKKHTNSVYIWKYNFIISAIYQLLLDIKNGAF